MNPFASLAGLVLFTGASFAASDPLRLSVTVMRDDHLVMQADFTLLTERQFVASEPGNFQLEIYPASVADAAVRSTVRLLDLSGPTPRVAHTTRSGNPPSQLRTIAYRICGKEVAFFSPAPPAVPSCATPLQ